METRIRQGPFAPRALPRFLATMTPSDSRPGRPAVMHSRRRCPSVTPDAGPPGRVSQVPRLICRHPPSPTTPGSPTAALLVASRSVLASPLLAGWPLSTCCNEAESGSLALRLTSSRSRGFDGGLPRSAAGSATRRTSNSHGQYLSTDKISQASPDAPNEAQSPLS